MGTVMGYPSAAQQQVELAVHGPKKSSSAAACSSDKAETPPSLATLRLAPANATTAS